MHASPVAFFRHMEAGYGQMLSGGKPDETRISALAGQAFDWFEQNIAYQNAGQNAIACDKGCPTCCSLRVVATAPEIFLLARYVRMVEATPEGNALGLRDRVAAAHDLTRGLDEQERLVRAQPCPLLLEGMCILHPVRSLTCRGHAAFDADACRAAAAGEDVEVAISEPHLTLRSLVQNALQSALRDAGLAWGFYELNAGLALALADPEREVAWLAGADSLAPATAACDMEALGDLFDRLHMLQ